MTTTTNVQQVKLNVMTQQQFNTETKNPNELYMITDAQISYNDLTDKPVEIPSQTGNSGKFLTTNGTTPSWATVDTLPSQSGNSGKFLTTNGTTASWGEIAAYTANEVETLWASITPSS